MLMRKLVSRLLICTLVVLAAPLCHSQEPSPPAAPQTAAVGAPVSALVVSPDPLTFDKQVVNATSPVRTLLLTNNSNSPLNGIYMVPAGDFESRGDCPALAAGASCAVTVTFTPKHSGEASGSLTIFANPSEIAKTPRVVLLRGVGLLNCNAVGVFWNRNIALAVVLAGLYFLGLALVRWHMIAKPSRAQLGAQIISIRSWVEADKGPEPLAAGVAERVAQINLLLNTAARPLNSPKIAFTHEASLPWLTRLFNALFWTRGHELAGWSCAHQAEQQQVLIHPPERVRAALEIVEQDLLQYQTAQTTALANIIHEALQQSGAGTLDRWRALLIEALSLVHNQRDAEFFLLASWHNQMMWLVGCALLFIVAIALTFQNSVLMLVGAVGGLLSRLSQTLRAAKTSNDYGSSWGALFLSPLTGALAAWGGILLVIMAAKLNILGAALNFDWCNPYEPLTLAVALLFGFTERLFDDMVTKLDTKLLKPDTAGSSPEPANPPANHPTIGAIDPKEAHAGEKVQFTVSGAKFQAGASASVTDEHGNATPAALEYIGTDRVKVTFTPAGASAYMATLTITNPDRRSARFTFPVKA